MQAQDAQKTAENYLTTLSFGGELLVAGAALITALMIGEIGIRLIRRKKKKVLVNRAPVLLALGSFALWAVALLGPARLDGLVELMLRIALIISSSILVGSVLVGLENIALRRINTNERDNRRARRAKTQVLLLRRLTVLVVTLLGIALVALQFSELKTIAASLFASAGLLSIVAGLAAQSSLANVFAGIQLTLTDALRVDDVVVVQGEWGNVEEITLVNVIVRIWDSRRLVLPTSYFTTQPFENWTRREADVLGSVEMDLDWEAPIGRLREEFTRMLEHHDLWDGQVGVFQVIDATGSFVRVRALVSADGGPNLFDLRCAVREHLVDWLNVNHPESLPRIRTQAATIGIRGQAQAEDISHSRLFSGSPEAAARAEEITGTIPKVE